MKYSSNKNKKAMQLKLAVLNVLLMLRKYPHSNIGIDDDASAEFSRPDALTVANRAKISWHNDESEQRLCI